MHLSNSIDDESYVLEKSHLKSEENRRLVNYRKQNIPVNESC